MCTRSAMSSSRQVASGDRAHAQENEGDVLVTLMNVTHRGTAKTQIRTASGNPRA